MYPRVDHTNEKRYKQNTVHSIQCNTITHNFVRFIYLGLSLWLIGTVRAEPETVISRAWVQSPDPAE